MAFVKDQRIRLLLAVTGTGPTSLGVKVWADGGAEPAGWLLQASDSTAVLQVPGGVGIEHYQSSTTANGPVTLIVDDLTATR